ncbi:HlyD family efflux transporter periplasmic adaptor subunit [Blastomonas sp. AAP53]|uniref:HlyD family secretion protein n=1 Tax=Blastomonas sp. AAP53 TaxID=1248760 RepID=UPI0003809E37|nr:HlyD family efflux transporter periplasmic adaptor subunit [Blastomonas sp. AAP53]
MTSPLFRQEAIETGRHRLTGTVIAAVPPSARLYTAFILIVVTALGLLLMFGTYAQRAQVRGIVAYSAGVARIMSPGDGKVETVHVREGQRVSKGDAVMTVALTEGRDASGEGIASQLIELDRQYSELVRQKALVGTLAGNETVSLQNQQKSMAQSLDSLIRQERLMAEQARLSEAQLTRSQRLMKQGAGTKAELEERQATLLARKLDREALAERIISQREALKSLEAQIAARSIVADQSGSQLAERMALVAEQRARLVRQDKLTLSAPFGGTVGDLGVQSGQRVNTTTALAVVVPANSALEVQLFAPSSAVGFVKPGQRVRLMFDAFPFQKYGTGSGTVTWVSSVPSVQSGLLATDTAREPVFRVRVRIDSLAQGPALQAGRLRDGMTLSANLILEDRRLWEVFLDPILKAIRS